MQRIQKLRKRSWTKKGHCPSTFTFCLLSVQVLSLFVSSIVFLCRAFTRRHFDGESFFSETTEDCEIILKKVQVVVGQNVEISQFQIV